MMYRSTCRETQLVHRDATIFTARKQSFGQGNVSTPVYQSFCSQGGRIPACNGWGCIRAYNWAGDVCIPACNWAGVCVSQHEIGQGWEGVGCGGVNFWYNLLLWSSGVAFWNGLLLWPLWPSGVPSGLPFCYGLLVWPSGWECPIMTFWCTPLPAPPTPYPPHTHITTEVGSAHPTGIHSCLDFNLKKFTKRTIEGKL